MSRTTLGAGTRIAHYEIRAHLGSGGMGDVYRAHDLTLRRDVALKFLPPEIGDDADRLRRFEQEARAASALNHPAIVAIYELGRSDEGPFISMELVEGQTVRELVLRGPVPPRRTFAIAAQIAAALAKAHAAGIVHRDLKPDNLMVSSDDHAKVLDFGLAKLTGEPGGPSNQATTIARNTREGVVMGTVGYMSPEQASGVAADFRSDQFSFGLVLYEMLTGRRPFERATAAETLSAIIRDDAPPMDLPENVPVPVRWIVERCLAKAPENRYASTHDLARDLANVRDHLSGPAAPSKVARRTSLGPRELVAWGAAALAIIAVGVLAFVPRGAARTSAVEPVRLTVTPPPGGIFFMSVGLAPFALSPDGRRLAFVSTVDRRRQLWVRSFDSLEARVLPGTEGAASPFWSPDGVSLGFFADNQLKRVPASGGDVITLCDTPGSGGGSGSWSRDDVILFAPAAEAPLLRVPAGGGTPVPVTTLDPAHGEAGHLSPVFLPDGRQYVFGVLGRDNAGLYLGALDSADRTLLVPNAAWVGLSERGQLFYQRERNLVAQRLDIPGRRVVGDPIVVAEGFAVVGPTPAVSVSANGDVLYWSGDRIVTQLTWMRRDGTTIGTVGPPGVYMNLGLSRDGRQAAVDRWDSEPSIWVIDLVRGAMSRATPASVYDSTPIWAPDGHSLVFASAKDSPPNLYLKLFDAQGEVKRLTRSTIQSFPQSWSKDGLIAFVVGDAKTDHDIWLVPAAGDREPWPIMNTAFRETSPRISPDGHWLAYVSNESDRPQVYVTRFPKPERKWPVSVEGGTHPMWRFDSRELYYRAPSGMLMAVTVGPGAEFDAGVAKPLFKPQASPGLLGIGTFYDVAADGRFLVNTFVERVSSPAVVVLNWAPPVAKR